MAVCVAVCGVVRAQMHSQRDQIHGVSNVCGSNAAFVSGCLSAGTGKDCVLVF